MLTAVSTNGRGLLPHVSCISGSVYRPPNLLYIAYQHEYHTFRLPHALLYLGARSRLALLLACADRYASARIKPASLRPPSPTLLFSTYIPLRILRHIRFSQESSPHVVSSRIPVPHPSRTVNGLRYDGCPAAIPRCHYWPKALVRGRGQGEYISASSAIC